MLTISFFGLLFGLLAAWRGNVRSAILVHAAVDVFGGLFPS
jgi:membrane protease YdiL (CAAX protease family)